MTVTGLEPILAEHPFFAGLDPSFVALVVGCAKNVRFAAGDLVFREGEPADTVYLIRDGRVALETAAPPRGVLRFLTLEAGEIAGVSWLIPPYRWSYDARAVELVRAVALDAVCLRQKCDADARLGYEVMKRFVPVLVERLHDAQLRMIDVYGIAS